MKYLKKIFVMLMLILALGVASCDKQNTGGSPTTQVETYTVTFEFNNGTSTKTVKVKENETVSKPTNPTKAGYGFSGWYSDSSLTKEFDFNSKITSDLKLYAKWEEKNLDPNLEYGLVENDLYIPTNLEFSKETHQSANHKTFNAMNFSSGGYATSFNSKTEGTTINSIRFSCYRFGKNGDIITLKPDNSYYAEKLYHGREGGLFNITPIGGINKFEITYSTNDVGITNPSNPNVRFGKDDNCLDYVYFLDLSTQKKTVTIDVNLSMYEYFSINSGDYNCYITSFTIDYDNNETHNPVYEETSGDNKLRINPIRYNKELVAGESKITAPLAYEYDESTNTYKVTKSKEFTYYTADYVRNHRDIKEEAAIIDPLEVCIYYTLFGKWPANYSTNTGGIQSLFGGLTRKVSKYNRTDGYCRAIPWDGSGFYYELDIDVDGSYTTSSRGVGRVVVWEKGWNAEGYDSSPVCIYTDDHYNTFIEYLNNGTWSNRFNAEGAIAAISYSTANTIKFTGFDANIVEGQGKTEPDEPVIPSDNPEFDNSKYYANYAPAELINTKTAMWQQVTQLSGIVEGNAYNFGYGTGSSTRLYSGCYYLQSVDGTLVFADNTPESYQGFYDITPFYFEIANGGYYLYRLEHDEKIYYGYDGPREGLTAKKTLWSITFSNGSFIMYTEGNSLQYNTTNDGFWRTYTIGSQNAINLYRFCDIEGAVPPEDEEPIVTVEYDTNYEQVFSVSALDESGTLYLVNYEGKECITDLSDIKCEFGLLQELMVPTSAVYTPIYFQKHYSEKWEKTYYYIYTIIGNQKLYLGMAADCGVSLTLEPTAYEITIYESYGDVYITPVVVEEDGFTYRYDYENGGYWLGYDIASKRFKFNRDRFTSANTYATNYIYRHVNSTHQEVEECMSTELVTNVSSIISDTPYVIFNVDRLMAMFEYNYYDFDSTTKELKALSNITDGLTYLEKHTINSVDYYSIYFIQFEHKRYYCCDKNEFTICYSDDPYYYKLELTAEGRVSFSPVEIDEAGNVKAVTNNGQTLYLGFEGITYAFVTTKESTESYSTIHYLYKLILPTEE